MLVVQGLYKRLGGRAVVDGVDLACDGGAIYVITGPNGAGKSTLLRLIAGIIEPDRGHIDLAGIALTKRPVAARRRLGYVPEAADPPGHLSGDELFGLVRALKRAGPLEPAQREALDLDSFAHQRIERMSLGQRRRVCLGAALIGDPAVLVLDEPTNGLDVDGVACLRQVLTACRDRGTTVLLATHDRAFGDAIADHHLELANGTVHARRSDDSH